MSPLLYGESRKMAANTHRPDPALAMFTGIVEGATQGDVLETVSRGLVAITGHVEQLMNDVDILREAGRYERAGFLLTVANEEIAKTYILLDMCRLDSTRHHSVLKCLCRAFYSHTHKLSYVQIQRRAENDWEMSQFEEHWDVEMQQWFPSLDAESGEPDLPGNVYFDRELPLYCEYFEDDGGWYAPNPTAGGEKFAHEWVGLPTEFVSAQADVANMQNASASGLYDARCLTILNEEFKGLYVNDRVDATRVRAAIQRLGRRIITEIGVAADTLVKSPLVAWPLYHFCSSHGGT